MNEADTLKQAAAALRQLSASLKIYGSPIAAVDLERMANGGTQDRRDDLLRLTSNQLSDLHIFFRLLEQFLDGVKGNKYPLGQAIELMGRAIGAPVTQRLVGAGLPSGPKIALGLQKASGGAGFKAVVSGNSERMFCEIVLKVLREQEASVKTGKLPLNAFFAHAPALERVAKSLDAVMIQRLVRDTLRSSPVTAAMGMDALRLLSPVADATELALGMVFLDALIGVARAAAVTAILSTHAQALAEHVAKAGRVYAEDLAAVEALTGTREAALVPCAANAEGAAALSDCLRRAGASALGVDLQAAGGFASAVFRRLMVLPKESVQAAGLVALGVLLEGLAVIDAAALPQAFAQGTTPVAGKGEWPALKAEELVFTADRVFDGKAKARDALPGGLNPGRGPAKMLLTLRGDWVVRTQMLALCTTALREGSPLDTAQRASVDILHKFLGNIAPEQRTELMKGLYQMATGDPDQRARQIGLYFLVQASDVLKPGLTLGPLRVAFAKFWRAVEGSL